MDQRCLFCHKLSPGKNNQIIDIFVLIGPDLPVSHYDHEMVNVGGDIVTVCNGYLGQEKHLYRLSCINNVCTWDKMAQELKTPRTKCVALNIPYNYANCN